MRLSILTLLLAAKSALAAQCNEDNCLRAIQTTALATLVHRTRSAAADCSSFFRVTVTPATVTVTATVSVTKSDTVYATSTLPTTVISTVTAFFADTITVTGIEVDTTTVTTSTSTLYHKRQVTDVPSAVPTYASPRSGVVKYSSACSCLGITETTIIVAATTTTVTVSQTTSTTTTGTDSTVTTFITEYTTNSLTLTGTTTTTTVNTVEVVQTPYPETLEFGPQNQCLYDTYGDNGSHQIVDEGINNYEKALPVCQAACQSQPECLAWSAALYVAGGGTLWVLNSNPYNPALVDCSSYDASLYTGLVVYSKSPFCHPISKTGLLCHPTPICSQST